MTNLEITARRASSALIAATEATAKAAECELRAAEALRRGDRKAARAAMLDAASHLNWAASRTRTFVGQMNAADVFEGN